MEKDGFARVMILGGEMGKEIIEEQRTDPLTTEITSDAETEDVGDGSRERVGGRQNVLIFFVASNSSFDFGHDEPHDFALQVTWSEDD